MKDSDFKNFNPQVPIATGFLGGITFSALVFFIQQIHVMKLGEILVPLTSGISFLFILATLGSLRHPSEEGSAHKHFFNLVNGYITAGLFGLMLIIPMMIYDYSLYASISVGIFEVATFGLFIKMVLKNPKLW